MQRIVRSRKSGWKKPPNTVYVGRPGKFSNPFKIHKGKIYGDASHRTGSEDPWVFIMDAPPAEIQNIGVQLYRDWVHGKNPYNVVPCPFTHQDVVDELNGYNLACWCKLHDDKGNHFPCHVDVLIEIIKASEGE